MTDSKPDVAMELAIKTKDAIYCRAEGDPAPSLDAIASLIRPEIERLEADNAALQVAEHKLSDAYVRLRKKIPGALSTPTAPTPEQVWAVTEAALDGLSAEHKRAVEALRERMIRFGRTGLKYCECTNTRDDGLGIWKLGTPESHGFIDGHPCPARPWEGR